MRHVAAIVVAGLALVVAGCGGKALGTDVDAGDGGVGDDGSSGDDGGTCTPLPGCTSRTTCNVGCQSCSCASGSWACVATHCFDASPPACPASPPTFGSYCVENGQNCAFGPGCGPQCTCTSNKWQCVVPPCPPPVCPSSPPSGACGGEVGLMCTYGSGCNVENCDCVMSGSGAQWLCSGTGCIDAGH